MFSVYQFNITSWERLSWLISKEMDPTIPTCCGFGIIIFLFVPVFLFYYFSLNYYFSNIRSDSWGKMLLVIWVVTGDLRGQCLMSHCLMIRKCACHQTMLLFHYLEMPFLSYCYIDFLYPCGFSTHSLFKKKTTTLLLAYTLFCTQFKSIDLDWHIVDSKPVPALMVIFFATSSFFSASHQAHFLNTVLPSFLSPLTFVN